MLHISKNNSLSKTLKVFQLPDFNVYEEKSCHESYLQVEMKCISVQAIMKLDFGTQGINWKQL